MNYTNEQIAAMTAEQLDQTFEEIRSHQNDADANLDDMIQAIDWIAERRAQLQNEAERRAQLRSRIATGATGTTVRAAAAQEQAQPAGPDSEIYHRAFLKNLAVRNGVQMFGDMTAEEQRAFTFTTTNSANVVPTVMMNRIVELVDSQAPMYADATRSNMTEGFVIPRHTAIAAGDAAQTAEGVANVDEEDTFDTLALVGVEIKKHLNITRKMKWQSVEAFGQWVETHIANRIAVAKEKLILARLDATATGIAAANVLTGVSKDDAGIRGALALIKGQGPMVCYANNYTIWNVLAGIDDGAGNKAFIPSPQVDPVVQGRVYGATVKLDDNLANNVAYIGIPRYIDANDYEALFINHAMDPTTFVDIVAGYSLFDAGLEHPYSFVKVTFTA